MQNGVCWELMPLDYPIIEPEYGFLPTMRACIAKHGLCWKRAEEGKPKGNLEDYLAYLYVRSGGKRVRGDVCVSVFRRPDDGVAPEVDELYDRHLDGWRKECKVAHDTQGGKKIECLWLNYNPQLTLFDMPTRLIRDAILTSGRVASLSWEAEVFYRRLMSVADDYGLYDARTPILRSALYPLQLDKMSECNIQRCLSACEAAGLILLYSHNEKPYLMILGFDQQGKSMPKWPLPNGYEVLKVSDKKYELRKLVTGRNDSPQPVTYANAYSETETKTDANAKKLPVSRGIEQFPRDAEDVRLFMAAQLMAPKGRRVETVRRVVFDDFSARGWRDSKGIPLADWKPAARKYARSWVTNNAQQGHQGSSGRNDANAGRRYE